MPTRPDEVVSCLSVSRIELIKPSGQALSKAHASQIIPIAVILETRNQAHPPIFPGGYLLIPVHDPAQEAKRQLFVHDFEG
jgi:hypothetical protein